MESVILGLRTLSALSLIMLLLGLYKPWMALWWEDKQYRLKVIRIYGTALLITWVISLLIPRLSF